MKRPLAYITAAWSGDDYEDTDLAARYCRAVYEAGRLLRRERNNRRGCDQLRAAVYLF